MSFDTDPSTEFLRPIESLLLDESDQPKSSGSRSRWFVVVGTGAESCSVESRCRDGRQQLSCVSALEVIANTDGARGSMLTRQSASLWQLPDGSRLAAVHAAGGSEAFTSTSLSDIRGVRTSRRFERSE